MEKKRKKKHIKHVKHMKKKELKRKKNSRLSKAQLKIKRRRARRRIQIMGRVAVAFLVLGAVGGGAFAIIWNLPEVKLNRELNAGDEYAQEQSYDQAVQAYGNALELDSTSVKAYRCMAGAYLGMQDGSHAKQVLYEGWENTQDESLLEYYCTVILNEAVDEINGGMTNLETLDKVESVLEQGLLRREALDIMGSAYRRLMEQYKGDGTAVDFAGYEETMSRLFALYQKEQTEEIGAMAAEHGYLDVGELTVPAEHVDAYLNILQQANEIQPLDARSDLIACLQKEKEIQEVFAGIFQEFDAGNYEAAKEFIVTDTYKGFRDAFIAQTMEYWTGETYIPVSREYVKLKQDEGKWTFSFPEFSENEATAGVITVWGVDMTDNDVLRTYISYEPAMQNGAYYPHVQYVISYMYSNLQKKNGFLYDMNYHFETRTWTEEGMTTHMVGDWGGPYQWEKTY